MNEQQTVQCAWCRRVKIDGEWVDAGEPETPATHHMCPDCYERINGEPYDEEE